MIERDNIVGEVNKVMQSSKVVNKFIRALKLTIIIQGRICKNVVNAYIKCDNIPILWKKCFLEIAHDRSCEYNQHCRERHFHNFTSCKSIINGCI